MVDPKEGIINFQFIYTGHYYKNVIVISVVLLSFYYSRSDESKVIIDVDENMSCIDLCTAKGEEGNKRQES